MKKKWLAVLLAGTMTMTLGACGSSSGSSSSDSSSDSSAASSSANKDAIRFVNTKIEIDSALKDFAKQ